VIIPYLETTGGNEAIALIAVVALVIVALLVTFEGRRLASSEASGKSVTPFPETHEKDKAA
jgi:hypothetical protein